MSRIKRFFVEKKKGLDNEGAALLGELKNLGAKGLEGVRILHRYDIENVSDEHLHAAKNTVLSEPPVEQLYEEEFSIGANEQFFIKEYLPGQFDQCADSLLQCLELISCGKKANAAYAKVYVLKGTLTGEELSTIKRYCHNPVDSRIGKKEKPVTLNVESTPPPDVQTVNLTDKTDEQARKLRDELGLAMSGEDFLFCRDYFNNEEKRNPTLTEIRVLDTYWSDHCRHTTFLTELVDIEIEDGYYAKPLRAAYELYLAQRDSLGRCERPVTLMDMATTGMRALKAEGYLEDLDESEEINACSVKIDVNIDGKTEKWLLMFKNETHNHPTEIEPYGGASTCLGGAIRDPLSGRAYVYQAMRLTGSADPRVPYSETLPGKLPQKKITTEAAAGYSAYGNQIGLATGYVREIYDEGFVAKRMECGALVGAAPSSHVVREAPKKGDLVLMVGGRTGRDGCGGATGSSKEHSTESLYECGAEVQKGNPPIERKILRLFANREASALIKRCNDFGAGGVSVAIGELADSLRINLDSVLKKYDGLDGTELAISESQERMAVVVSAEKAEAFIRLAEEENLECVPVAEVTEDGYIRMLWRGKEIVSIKRGFLDTNGAPQKAKATIKCPESFDISGSGNYSGNIKDSLISVMKDLNACSQKGLIERFDSTIGGGTVLAPFGGENQLTPEDVMAAKVPITAFEPLSGRDTSTVSVMSAAYDPAMSKESPFHGGLYAVVESVARLVAAGCEHNRIRLSFQEYFEKMTGPESWGKPASALLGAFSAQLGLKIPAIGGKDSMSGTFGQMSVPPVLASFAVSAAEAENVKSAALTGSGNLYALIPEYDKYGVVDLEGLKERYDWFYNNIKRVTAAAAVKKFGIAETVSKMCFGNGAGVEFDDSFIKKYTEEYLFAPIYGAIIFEVDGFIDQWEAKANNIELIGAVNRSGKIVIGKTEIKVSELISEWEKPLEKIFPSKTDAKEGTYALKLHRGGAPIGKPAKSGGGPNVFIPIFPGTNCEYDSQRAFALAGAKVETFVFKNVKSGQIKESIEKITQHIARAQIIMLPGGFSAGDEPNGSAKFISAVFRNPYVSEAIREHLNNKDGLILGICNGFQALIKLGLLPHGEISEITDESPTIYYNEIGRHVSQLVDIKVISNRSPFLSAYSPKDIYKVPVSHGEGRFIASDDWLKRLNENGQIATVYVDGNGAPAAARPFNPGGSAWAIEGLLSPDGRVFGRMGHPERAGRNTFVNVPGEYDMKIFKSAVDYYKL